MKTIRTPLCPEKHFLAKVYFYVFHDLHLTEITLDLLFTSALIFFLTEHILAVSHAYKWLFLALKTNLELDLGTVHIAVTVGSFCRREVSLEGPAAGQAMASPPKQHRAS